MGTVLAFSCFLLDGIEEVAEYEAGGARVSRYLHDPSRVDAILAQTGPSGTTHYAVTDALGSVYALTDGEGTTRTRYEYDAYGQRTASSEAVATKFGFTGRVHEAGVPGEMYYRARYLDNSTGRWNAADPSGMPDGPNRYLYAFASPVLALDPFGLRTLVITGNPVFPQDPLRRGALIKFTQGHWNSLLEGFMAAKGEAADVRSIGAAWELTLLAIEMQATELNVYDKVIFIGHAYYCDPTHPECGPALQTDVLTPRSFGAFLWLAGLSTGSIVACGSPSGSGQTENPALDEQASIGASSAGVELCYTTEAAKFHFSPGGSTVPTALTAITGEVSGASFPESLKCIGP